MDRKPRYCLLVILNMIVAKQWGGYALKTCCFLNKSEIGELKTVEVGSVSSASGKTYGDPHYYLDKNMKLKKKGGSDHYSQLSITTIVKDHVIDAKLLKYKN